MYLLFMAIVAIILILLLVVGIHEAAHAAAARFFGVRIQRISLGFGRPLLRWQGKNGCEWVWALWPLGGYVQMLNTRIEPVDEKDYPVCFDKKPVWQRIVILLAGSVANLIFAFFALTIVFSLGLDEQAPVIGTVTENSAAARAGIVQGDSITQISGQPVSSWREVGMRLIFATGTSVVAMEVSNNQHEKRDVMFDLQSLVHGKSGSLLGNLGIVPDKNSPEALIQASSLGQAFQMSLDFIWHTILFMLKVLQLLITKVLPFSLLSGPLGMFSLTIATFMEGLVAFIFFAAGFSIAVGVINLFPIPGLDGGSIVYALVEKAKGKPVSVALEILLHRFAMIIAGLLLVQLILNDLTRTL